MQKRAIGRSSRVPVLIRIAMGHRLSVCQPEGIQLPPSGFVMGSPHSGSDSRFRLPSPLGSRQPGSNANVADGGIRGGTRSDEIRPIIRPWPLPPLRPKRAASGVAGLRYGSGQRMTNHALMSETSAIGWLANSHYFKQSVPLEVRHTLSFTGGPFGGE